MTAERLRECLEVLGWSQRHLADQLRLDPKQVQRWGTGTRIPAHVEAWLERLVTAHVAHPAPEKVR